MVLIDKAQTVLRLILILIEVNDANITSVRGKQTAPAHSTAVKIIYEHIDKILFCPVAIKML